MKFCPNCGSPIMPQTKFCSECGQKLNIAPPTAEPPVQQAAPVFEAPAAPAYEAPAAPVAAYEPPAAPAPVYEAPVVPPAPVYEAPVVPPAPVYEAPAAPAPVYEAPVVPPAPVYEAPAAPPQQPAAFTYTPPVQPPLKKKFRTGLWIFLGILGVVILGIVLLVIFGPKKDKNIGFYEGVSMMGQDVSADELWLELKEDNAFVLYMMGDRVKGEWSLEGEDITLEAEDEKLKGTLKDGKLVLKMEELELEFKKSDSGKKSTGKEEPEDAEEVGYWTLLRIENEDPERAVDESGAEMLKGFGMEIFLVLEEDGTGVGSIMMDTELTWEDGTMELEQMSVTCKYTLEDDLLLLTVEDDDSTYVFQRGEGDPPTVEIGEGVGENTANYEWWNGDWYGWWIVSEGYGDYEYMKDWYYDTCASITVNEDGTGTFILWDAGHPKSEPLVTCQVEFSEGWGENGCMASVSGTFDDCEIGYIDWVVDPETCSVSEFENMISIEGTYVDPEAENASFDYIIILRPWGMDWEDVRTADTSESIYEDMMPGNYDSWYVPMILGGVTKAPDTVE